MTENNTHHTFTDSTNNLFGNLLGKKIEFIFINK